MDDLIEALNIFRKYGNKDSLQYPTHCEHDELMVCVVENEDDIPKDARDRLDGLGFFWSDEYDCFVSYRYGSC